MQPPDRPVDEGARATAANWRDAPYNRWAFWHVGDVLPTQRVPRGDGPVRELPTRTKPFDVRTVELTRVDGAPATVGDVLDDTYTDAYAVLQDGAIVTEWYGELGAPDRGHLLMSISKSVVGCVTAVLAERRVLDLERSVSSYVPELAGLGYGDATVRQVLDMRSGVSFREDYLDPSAEVCQMDDWIGWRPEDGGEPRGLYRFLMTLSQDRPHGGPFRYRSSETDVLGWVCERAADEPMAALIETCVWAPMGAEQDAEIICDSLGTAVHDGGLVVTARDLLRFGQLMLDGGTVPGVEGGVRTVVPPGWLRQGWAVDSDIRQAFVDSPADQSFRGGWYRNQLWFRPGEHGDVLLCLGINGQMLHVNRRTRTVCAKLSSWPLPQQPAMMQDTLRAFDALGGALGRVSPRRAGRLDLA